MEHRVCIIQRNITWLDVEANLCAIEREVADVSADVFVLSEMFQTGFATDPRDVAESEAGRTLEWMREFARSKDAAVAGSIAVAVDGEYRNRMYFVKPDGSVAYYDKHHLFTIGDEDKFFTAGNKRIVVEWRGVRYLLQVCFDLRFPVWSRQQGDYDVAIYSALWPAPRRDVWQLLLKARAVENQCYVVGVNRIGDEPTLQYVGDSVVVDPYGRESVSLGAEAGVAVACIDLERLNAFREKFAVGREADKFEIIK